MNTKLRHGYAAVHLTPPHWKHFIVTNKKWQTLILLSLAGCVGETAEAGTLRIAVLPILDTLPMYVAEAEGYFAEQGVMVEFVIAASAAERDQLLQAGQVDGFITDLVALALCNQDEARVIATRYAMVPTPGFAQFRVMASGPS